MADGPNYIYDDQPIGTAGFGSTADTSSITAAPPPPPQTWGQLGSDVGKLAIGSTESQIGDIGRTLGYQQFGDDWNKSGQAWTGSVSPGGQEITNAPLFSGTTLEHPFSKTLMGAAKSGLWNAAMVPGAGWGAMAGRAAIGGVLGYTGAYGGVVDSIQAQPDDQLQKNSPTYMELRKTLPEYDAKQALADQAWGNIGPVEKAAILGTSALAGEAGPLATVGKTISSAGGKTLASLATGKLARTAIGAAETGGVQAGQYLGTAIPTREALSSVGAPTDTVGAIATGAIEQGAIGAVVGGGSRFIRKPVGGEYKPGVDPSADKDVKSGTQVVQVPAGQADPAEAQALQSSIGRVPAIMDYGPDAQPIIPKMPGGMPEPTGPSSSVIPGMGKVPAVMDAGPGVTKLPNVPRLPDDMLQPRGPSEPIMPKLPGGMPEPTGPSEPINRPPIPIRPTPSSLIIPPDREPSRFATEPEPTPAPTKPSEPTPTPTSSKYGPMYDKLRKAIDEEPPTKPPEPPSKPSDAQALKAKKASAKTASTEAPVTKDSDLAELHPETAKWLQEGEKPATEPPKTGPEILQAKKGTAKGTFDVSKLKAEAPAEPITKKDALQAAAQAVATKTKGTFDVSKIGKKAEAPVEPTEAPTAPTTPAKALLSTRTQAKQAAIERRLTALTKDKFDNLLQHGKIKKASVSDIMASGEVRKQPIYQHPTTGEYYVNTPAAKEEVPVKVIPPSDVRLGGLKISDETLKAAAEHPPKSEEPAPLPVKKTPTAIADALKAAADRVKKGKRDITDVLQRTAALPDEDEHRDRIEGAKQNVHPNPTDAQKVAGNYQQGHPPASATQGQKVTITSSDGEKGGAKGRILGSSKNIPGEHLETIIHPDGVPDAFHVINQIDRDTGQFAGHMVVQGAKDSDRALLSYQRMMEGKYGEEVKNKVPELSYGVVHMTPEDFDHWKQTRNPEEPVYPTASGKHPFNYVETTAGKFRTEGSSTVKTALEEALRKIPNTTGYLLYRKLAQQVIKYLPDVPVYYLKQSDLEKIRPNSNAVYSAAGNHILMGEASVHPELTLLHEALHAATMHLYYTNRTFRVKVDKLTQEYKQGLPGINDIMPGNVRKGGGPEMLAELAIPKVQSQLAQIQMSDKLASDLNMSAWAKGTRTLWNGIVNAFKDALREFGMNIPGKDDISKHTLLDGLLRLNDEAFLTRSKNARTDFADMIRASKGLNDHIASQLSDEHNSQGNIYGTIHNAVSNPETVQDHYLSDSKSISDRVKDLIDKAPKGVLLQKAFEYVVPFEGSDALRMDREGSFGPKTEANSWRRLNETSLRRDSDLSKRFTTVNNTIADMFKEYHGHTKAEVENLSDTLAHATAYMFDPRHKVGEGNNKWMESPGWQWRNEAKQALANSDRITRMYNAIPETLKPRFGKIVDDYRQAAREQAETGTNELIDSITNAGQKFLQEPKVIDPKDIKTKDRLEYVKFHNDWETNWDKNKEILRDHILKNELTEDEERWLAERGFKDISDIRNLANPRGVFVPLDHGGDFIINARTKIDIPTNGKLIDGTDNVVEFKTPEEAEAFLNKQPPKSNMSTVYFNDKGETVPKWDTWQNPDGSVGFAKDNKAYRVEVNNKYYSGHDSISAANRRYEQLKASGLYSKIAPPQSQRSGWYSGLEISSPLFKHLISEVEKRTDYTDGQKKAVIQLLKDSALSSMEGNRIAKHLLPRKAVAGWDTDYIKTYKNYFDPHNALMSRTKYAKDINSATNEMIKYADDHQFEAGATERSLILKELNKRDNFFGTPNHLGDEGSNKLIGRVMKYAEAASFFANMVSPGHIIVHQTHQILTADMLAAKYGPMKTMARASKMHGIMAGTGFRNILQSVKAIRDVLTKDSKGFNYVEGLMDKVSQDPKYGAELKAMLNEAIATNRLHPDQGFDASVLNMGTGRLDRGLARLDLASRQTMGATEAYSRVWGYSTAYTLARDAGETPQQAMRTAFDTVSRTQGLLSRSNMSSVMNKWYMRAPMQFRAWGINMMMTLAKSIHDIFKPDAPGVRAEAVRRLLYLFGSTAALTGINGMPSDAMRVGLALTGALGLTNYNWSDAQNKMREFFAKETSPDISRFLMDGLLGSLGPFSFYGADRVGFGSLAVFGEPDDYTKGSLSKWILQIMGGAPYEKLWSIRDGVDSINKGDYAGAVSNLVPFKIIDDWAKAWKGAYQGFPTKTGAPGMEPYSAGETFMQSLGLTPARRERFREASEIEYRAEQSIKDEQSQLLNALGSAKTESDRTRAQMQIAAYNLRNPDGRITLQDVTKAMRRQTTPSGLGRTLTNRNRERIQSLESYYEAY